MVADFMYHPQAADFKNVEFHVSTDKEKNNVIGNVCGQVFTFKDDAPYKYKKFIVQVAEDKVGRNIFSFPLFDFESEIISEHDFQKIWDEMCN